MGTKHTTITTFRNGVAVHTEPIEYTTTPEQDNEEAIRDAMRQALTANRTYLAAAGTPNNTQLVAQIRALTRQVNSLIRLANGQLDAAD